MELPASRSRAGSLHVGYDLRRRGGEACPRRAGAVGERERGIRFGEEVGDVGCGSGGGAECAFFGARGGVRGVLGGGD